jgi:hypothetical protein
VSGGFAVTGRIRREKAGLHKAVARQLTLQGAPGNPAYRRRKLQPQHKYLEMNGARKRTRTSTTVRPLAPEASASASSAIRAQGAKNAAIHILRAILAFVNEAAGAPVSLSRLSHEMSHRVRARWQGWPGVVQTCFSL